MAICEAQQTFPVNGTHDSRHNYYAFTHARIFEDYTSIIDDATLLIKDGQVIDIGVSVALPNDAIIYDCHGKTIYPSFIDLYTGYGIQPVKPLPRSGNPQMMSAIPGAFGWNQAVKSQVDADQFFHCNPTDAASYRAIGFGTTLTSQHDGIVQGSYALVTFADTMDNEAILQGKAAAGYSFNKGSSIQDYPSSLMGSIALIRQTYLDAEWYKNAKHKTEVNLSLEAFNDLQNLPQIFLVDDKLSTLRADKIAREFGVKYIIKGSGDEYQLLDAIKNTGRDFIIPLNFPDKPDVQDPYDARMVSFSTLLNWEMAPLNPGALEKSGINFSLTIDGLKDKGAFLTNLRKAVKYGLSTTGALKALTYTPASMVGMQDKIGSLKKGMLANFIVTSGDIFKQGTCIYSNWIKGYPYQVNDTTNIDLRGSYSLSVDNTAYTLMIGGDANTQNATVLDDKKHNISAFFHLLNPMVTLSFRQSGDTLHPVQLSGLLSPDHTTISGTGTIGIRQITWQASLTKAFVDTAADAPIHIPSIEEVRYPFCAYGRTALEMDSIKSIYKDYVIRNATVWTGEKDSILLNTDVFIKDGIISAIGKKLSVPTGEWEVDGTGKYLTAGIVDEHSHIAASGGVNEGAEACSSEVRIGDVLNSEDICIYRSLAGGVIGCQVLHGSANPIGGQSGIIKLRWGVTPEQMKIQYAIPFIKFALGENVKQANWGDIFTVRYPQTRMGVEQFYFDNFTRAKEYQSARDAYGKLPKLKSKDAPDAPRKDLQLEALSQILQGKRFITSHSYVQSEINMLMHVCDSFHFHFNTFTHGLEAYKVADKIAARNIGVSCFSDWWAYKMEVMEAIPYNAAICTKMGIVTAINSDDDEMQRRLNQEAAKSVKYGGLTEQQCWRMITINPAKLLHLDEHTGSIKVGKDADMVLWSGNPLSIYTKAEKTFVDGICLYDIQNDAAMQKEIAAVRASIINQLVSEVKPTAKKVKK